VLAKKVELAIDFVSDSGKLARETTGERIRTSDLQLRRLWKGCFVASQVGQGV